MVSRNLGDLWIHACPSVRPYVRIFWEIRASDFSDLILTPNFLISYFLYEIVLLFQYFRLLCGTCDQILAHFRGSCCVKMTKNSSKSIFFEPFDLIMTGNLFNLIFSYEICIVNCLFNVFICHSGPCDQFLGPFRGSCCLKMTKNSSKSTFLEPFDLVMTGNLVYFLFSHEIFIADC